MDTPFPATDEELQAELEVQHKLEVERATSDMRMVVKWSWAILGVEVTGAVYCFSASMIGLAVMLLAFATMMGCLVVKATRRIRSERQSARAGINVSTALSGDAQWLARHIRLGTREWVEMARLPHGDEAEAAIARWRAADERYAEDLAAGRLPKPSAAPALTETDVERIMRAEELHELATAPMPEGVSTLTRTTFPD